MGSDDERQVRLAQALRENLRKRKAQARGVAAADPPVSEDDGSSPRQP
ncbi:hypothetical protein SAMN06297144_0262 [Sphingomonas guangdongensis]|uniref:Uncharacterized protein n=1 Tax=Sphingomonas guangdongensis TaxID=1141890 RepID=A0A285QAD4_9SPHN|nr:hypothetical protein [Sphingomonas guangdongensis]SOB78880.1 hypothetical protein SAMN06297144_0262 [Sphingomonas guangdongensis]